MARESEFIDRLSDFTKSLDSLVELLKEQQKIGPTEVVNQLLENIDADAIASIAANMEIVKENTFQINKNVEKTLEVVKSIKKERETGMFGEIDDKKNQNTIVSGVKTIILIASGVLAIGMAFKMVGSVDFFSVVALGMGIMFTAKAFAAVASITDDKGKPITYKRALMVSLMLVTMSAAVMLSGHILNLMPTLGPMELITIIGVGVSMGVATFFLLKSISKLTPKSLALAPFIPLIVPAIAAGIVGAGVVLQFMPIVPLSAIISALGVSIALAPMAIAFGFLAKSLKETTIKEIMMVGVAIPIMALGIVLSSIILQGVQDIPLVSTIKAGLGIGLAITAMVPTMWMLSKAGLLKPAAIKDLAIGVAAVVLISTAIMLSSWILSVGNYDGNYPGFEWSLSVGLAIVAFSIPMAIVGLMAMTGIGLPSLALGLVAVPIIAAGIVLTSLILGSGNYGIYPSYDWTLGVGLSLLTFGLPMLALGTIILMSFGLGLVALATGMNGILLIADTIQQASHILGKGYYTNYPTIEWAGGVGGAIMAFAKALVIQQGLSMMSMFGGVDVDLESFIIKISNAILVAGSLFSTGGNFWQEGNYPDLGWAEGVGGSIMAFAKALEIQTNMSLLSTFFGGSGVDLGSFITTISTAILGAGHIFSTGGKGLWDEGTYPSKSWSDGVGGSILAFAQAMAALDDAGIDIDSDDLHDDDGAVAIMLGLSEGIIEVGKYFSENGKKEYWDLKNVPTEDWANGIGQTLKTFAESIKALDDAGLDIDADDLKDGDGAVGVMLGLSEGIVEVGKYFNDNTVDYNVNNVPGSKWSTAVGEAIGSFSEIVEGTEVAFMDMFKILGLVGLIVDTAESFSKITQYNLPSKEWSQSYNRMLKDAHTIAKLAMFVSTMSDSLEHMNDLTKTMSNFAKSMFDIDSDYGEVFGNDENNISNKISKSIGILIKALPKQNEIDPLWSLVGALNDLSNINWSELIKISLITDTIGDLADQIRKIDNEKVESLAKLGIGLQIISLVDEEKLKSTLAVIKEKSSALKEISDDGSMIRGIFDNIVSRFDNISGADSGVKYDGSSIVNKPGDKDESSFEEQLLAHVKSIDEIMIKMSDKSDADDEEKLEAKDVDDKNSWSLW